ncbi:hypothetical protein KAI87_11880 [Myxococcota bacterium]|nr:hypothetical protein [Myxococcota bacterium]
MNTQPLGRLKKLELRTYWKREDTDFTPWLSEEENIALLGDAVGLELEVQEQEAHVGPFRAANDLCGGSLLRYLTNLRFDV